MPLKNNLAFLFGLILFISPIALSGCWIAAAGIGAEAGYVGSQDDRTTTETLKDQFIVSAIKAKLLASQRAPGMDINVDCFKQHVTLRGALRTQDEIDAALEIAENTKDVLDVESKLVLVS